MNRIKAKLAKWAKDRRLVQVAVACAIVIVLLIAGLCISIGMQSNIQHRITNATGWMQEQTFQGMIRMSELFTRVDDPEVDVQYKLIPQLRAEFTGVSALNTALSAGFGEKQAVLTAEQIAAFETAFEEYDSAYRQGLATGLAQADMEACIEGIRAMIDERYAPEVEPTEPVVVIDGSSGTIKQ